MGKIICDIQYDEIRREPIRRRSTDLRIFRLVAVARSRAADARARCQPGQETIRQPPGTIYLNLARWRAPVLSAFATYCQRFGLDQRSGVQQKQAARSVA